MISWNNKICFKKEDFITGEKFENLHDENKSIIYSQIEENPFYKPKKYKNLSDFISSCSNKNNIKLITHNGDEGITDLLSEKVNSIIIKWFGRNVETNNPKVYPLPIGLENSYWPVSNFKINYIMNQHEKEPNKHTYVNFKTSTNKNIREKVLEYFLKFKYPTIEKYNQNHRTQMGINSYFDKIKDHKFIISPRGNGLDCHRTWETLYLNRIPVIKNEYKMKLLFEDLPVIFVDSFEQVSEKFLNDQYEIIKSKSYNFKKLTINYWYDLILNHK